MVKKLPLGGRALDKIWSTNILAVENGTRSRLLATFLDDGHRHKMLNVRCHPGCPQLFHTRGGHLLVLASKCQPATADFIVAHPIIDIEGSITLWINAGGKHHLANGAP